MDGQRVVSASFAIARYHEETYSDRPSLFGGSGSVALARFVNAFADTVAQPWIARLIVSDTLEVLTEKDRAYLARTGRYAWEPDRDAALPEFRSVLQPLHRCLRGQPFLGDEARLYADYILFGGFQWVRCVSAFELLADDDPVQAWRERLLDFFEGLARRASVARNSNGHRA